MVERRALAPFEVRFVDDTLGTFSGIASRYDVIDAYGTMMARGCFDRTLKEKGSKFPLCWQHDSDSPIGYFEAFTSDVGLQIKGQICLETDNGWNAYALLKQGAIDGLSIGFDVRQSERRNVDGQSVEAFTDVELWEASVVTFAACPGASVTGVRSMERMTRGLDDLGDDAKKAVADIFEQTAKSIRDSIGKFEPTEPQEAPKGEETSEDTSDKEEPADEPVDGKEDEKDDTEERAIAVLRECRSILKEVSE